MEFTISKANLVCELNLMQGIVAKESTIPILTNVLLEAGGDRVVLTGTDLESGIRGSCEASVKSAGALSVPARRLFDYARLLPDADIRFKAEGSNWISVVCGKSKARIAGMAAENFPKLASPGAAIAEIALGVLAAMIARVEFAVSREASRFTLEGAMLMIGPGEARLIATDGHRLALVRREITGGEKCRVIVPRKALAQIEKLAAAGDELSPVVFSRADNHLFFEVEGRTLISRELSGTFPDYERVLPKEQPYAVTLEGDVLRAAIQRVGLFSDEVSHALRVSVAKGAFTLRSASAAGESEEDIPIEEAGSLAEMGFNGAYLMDFLKCAGAGQVRFLFKDPQGAGEFRPAAATSEDDRYVVMPMRV
jgi:DNA polymerase-3 subunit beta